MNADALFNVTGLVAGTTTYGTGNTASMMEKFTIVKMVDPVVPPEVTITAPGATIDAPFTATLTFTKAVSALAMTDIIVTGGQAGTPAKDTTVTDGTVWTVEITPLLGVTEITVDVAEAKATNAGMAHSVTAESPPTVTIALDTTATVDAAFMATLTFSEEVALAMADIDVTGGTAGTPMPETADAAEDMVWTVEITPTDDATSVTVGVMAAKATGTAQTVTKAGTLAAGDYVVVVRDMENPPELGSPTPDLMEWAEMPDLEDLFSGDATLQLKVEGATRLQVVFSEVMWAVDEGKLNEDAYTASQWIELHNRTSGDNAKNFALSAITFATSDKRPALAEETDRISNVVDAGKDWILGKGQNGNSGAADGTGMVEFISMYRNNEGEPGHQDSRWTKSTNLYAKNYRGTPGEGQAVGVKVFNITNPALTVVFNEVSNRTDVANANASHEWIELMIRSGDPHFENWRVSYVTEEGKETVLFDLPKLDVSRYESLLLITASDPAGDKSHPLAAGYDVTKSDADNAEQGRDNMIRYYDADWKAQLPDDKEFVLMLRNDKGKTNHEAVQDIAGYDSAGLSVNTPDLFTNLWPLINYPAPNIALNALEVDKVHRRQKPDIAGTRTADSATNADHVAMRDVGWTGIGYKRNAPATAVNGGTPGYPNGALQSEGDNVTKTVIISEIMYDTTRNFTQWIELHNTSKVHGLTYSPS